MSKKYIALDNVLLLIDSIVPDVSIVGDDNGFGLAEQRAGISKHQLYESILKLPAQNRYEAITNKSLRDLAIFLSSHNIPCDCCAYNNHGCDYAVDCTEGIEQWLKGEADDKI